MLDLVFQLQPQLQIKVKAALKVKFYVTNK